MKGISLFEDDSGVSPVIGVVLMVAITVLLAATAAAFVLDLGNASEEQDSPTLAFGFEYDTDASGSDSLTITHKSGDAALAKNLAVVVEDASASGSNPNGRYEFTSFGYGGTSEITAGDSITLETGTLSGVSTPVDFSDATVQLVWIKGEQSTELQDYSPSKN